MKRSKDKFSKQSSFYKRFRPIYPIELYDYLLSFVDEKNTCLDCGTGNGQVASLLADYFKKVHATDISENQLKNTIKKENILYSVQRAEQTNFPDSAFDLITVAQAIHWFDFKFFSQEVKRVLKPKGVLAVWAYGLLRVTPKIDKLIDLFYTKTVGPYWNKERKHIDTNYQSVVLDLQEIDVKQQFSISTDWTLKHLEGYLNSWSSVQNYIDTKGENPVPDFIKQLAPFWKEKTQTINFPLFLRVFKID